MNQGVELLEIKSISMTREQMLTFLQRYNSCRGLVEAAKKDDMSAYDIFTALVNSFDLLQIERFENHARITMLLNARDLLDKHCRRLMKELEGRR